MLTVVWNMQQRDGLPCHAGKHFNNHTQTGIRCFGQGTTIMVNHLLKA